MKAIVLSFKNPDGGEGVCVCSLEKANFKKGYLNACIYFIRSFTNQISQFLAFNYTKNFVDCISNPVLKKRLMIFLKCL